jgi:Type I restriction enzyme R protein N terminus (HSDR_N)
MKYYKNGKDCLLCVIRKKIIIATPEEYVRQSFVAELIYKYQVPQELIEVEVPISYFQKGQNGRADIIVYELNIEDNILYPLILVECKEPNVMLTDKVEKQALAYNEQLNVNLIVLTNGSDKKVLLKNDTTDKYDEIKIIPKYNQLIDKTDFSKNIVKPTIWKRPNHLTKSKNIINKVLQEDIIGNDSDKSYYSFFINLYGLLYDESDKFNNLKVKDFKFISDEGIRKTTFSNSGGGNWSGKYRYFIFEDSNNDNQIISLSIMGKSSTENNIGYTILLVAIDDFESSHLALQLSLDKSLEKNKNFYSVTHNGNMTIGDKGRVKNKEVIEYIKSKRPKLVINDKIFLGNLDNSMVFKWNNSDVKEFIQNIIDYSFLRDELRRLKKVKNTEE